MTCRALQFVIYADDLFIDEAMALLKFDCENGGNWSISNGMNANPGKFQFIIVSPHDVTVKKTELLVNDVMLKQETSVKVG